MPSSLVIAEVSLNDLVIQPLVPLSGLKKSEDLNNAVRPTSLILESGEDKVGIRLVGGF